MLDLVLAAAHHVLVFALAGILAAELALVGPAMGAAEVRRLTMIDVGYGALAGAVIAVGAARVLLAAKGWAYYSANPFFWAKMATFAAIGVLSIVPTTRYLGWQRTFRQDGSLPAAGAIRLVRAALWVQAALLAIVLFLAAAMARGAGLP